VKLVYIEELPDRKSAMKREIAIKKMKRGGKSRLIGEAGRKLSKETSKHVNRPSRSKSGSQ
jgi:predicted GIY-YIG superfamily endonuclease